MPDNLPDRDRQSAGHDAGLSAAAAAAQLGVSERTLRRWISGAGAGQLVQRRGLPAFRGEQTPDGLRVQLLSGWQFTGQDAGRVAGHLDRQTLNASGETPDMTGTLPVGETEQLRQQLAALAHERDGLAVDKGWLQQALEREQTASAELRRMLNLEQQTVAAVTTPRELAAPAESVTSASEMGERPPPSAQAATHPHSVDAETLLKRGGLGRKQRRKLLDRLAGMLGR